METCKLSDFMKSITPWLDGEYILNAYIDERGHFVVRFRDGVKNVYHIEDCEAAQLRTVLEDLKNRGVPVDL